MARDIRIALVGFGNVGRRFAEQLRGPYARALKAAGARVRVTGIATARHGTAIDPRGLDLGRALRLVAKGGSLDALHRGRLVADVRAFIARVPADVLVEITTLDPQSGQPAIAHVRQALDRGMHVVTANKGPVAFALRPLRALAARKKRLFLHEGTVMDGTPVFNLAERCLRGARVVSFRGTLNSTTNLVLSRMEEGLTAERRGEGGPAARHRRGRSAQRPRGLGRGGEGLRDRQRPHGLGGAPGAGAAARDRGSHRARRAARGAGGDAAAARRPRRPAGADACG